FVAAAARAAADDPLRASLRGAAPAAVAELDWERIHDRFSAVLAEIVDRRSQDRQARGVFLVAPD
ncbi:MAG TPA: glycosyltransferase family 1 protein, partial [Rhodocyclaceae bacterium]|nr:glycosyltransferase family 1 protein [Rhodocyclaceae bacterium]